MPEQYCELGFYTLAGHSDSPRDLVDEVREAERLGLGSAFISERFNVKDAADAVGRGRCGQRTHRHRHRRDEPQHPPPAGHRDVRHDDAPPHRRSVRAWARARVRPALRRDGPADRSRWRSSRTSSASMRRLWHGEMIFGHDGPAGSYPFLALRTRRSTRTSRDAGARSASGRSSSRAGCMDGVILHTFFTDETLARSRRRGAPRRRAGRPRSRTRCASGPCSPPSATTSTRSSGCKKLVGRLGDLPAGLRRPAGAGRTAGIPPCSTRFRADECVRGVRRRASTPRRRPTSSSTSRRCSPTSGSRRRPPGTPEQCAAARARPVRRRRRPT